MAEVTKSDSAEAQKIEEVQHQLEELNVTEADGLSSQHLHPVNPEEQVMQKK